MTTIKWGVLVMVGITLVWAWRAYSVNARKLGNIAEANASLEKQGQLIGIGIKAATGA